MFWKEWTKWEHVLYGDSCDTSIYEVFKRTCLKTGISQYKTVLVSKNVYGVLSKLIKNENINKSC